MSTESGVQFYTNYFSDPAKTARKAIHGGNGKVGDGYVRNSTYPFVRSRSRIHNLRV